LSCKEEVSCVAKLESDHGRLLITFQDLGKRCREYLGLKDTREHRRAAQRLLREIELDLATGQLDYGAKFPQSRNLERFGLERQSAVVPTLGEFGWQWIQERWAAIESPTRPPTTTRSFSKLMSFNPRSQSGDSTKFTMVTSTL